MTVNFEGLPAIVELYVENSEHGESRLALPFEGLGQQRKLLSMSARRTVDYVVEHAQTTGFNEDTKQDIATIIRSDPDFVIEVYGNDLAVVRNAQSNAVEVDERNSSMDTSDYWSKTEDADGKSAFVCEMIVKKSYVEQGRDL